MRIRRTVVRKNIPTSSHLERESSLARSLARVRNRGVDSFERSLQRRHISSHARYSRVRCRRETLPRVFNRLVLCRLVLWSTVSFRHNTKPRHCRPHDPPLVFRWVLLRRRGQRAPREVRDAIRHRRGMKKTRELNGVSARAMALCAVALCVTTLGAREAVQSKTVANFHATGGTRVGYAGDASARTDAIERKNREMGSARRQGHRDGQRDHERVPRSRRSTRRQRN